MSCASLTIGATGLVTLTGLADNITGSPVNNAIASGVLYQSDRTTQVASFNLAYVAASNGNYQGTIAASDTATLVAGTTYRIKVTATASGNTFVEWLDCVADY